MVTKALLYRRGKNAKRESKFVDFKESFDPSSSKDWCEVVKDIVAMANSGGGILLFGVKNDGTQSRIDPKHLLQLDPADITNKIAKYTGIQFSDFEIDEIKRESFKAVGLLIYPVSIPIVFIKPGTYDIGGGKQWRAFSEGTIYFRHGAKSEPCISDDIKSVVERELERIRDAWLSDIRKVVEAPTGSNVMVLPPEVVESAELSATPIRIVDDPDAPAYLKINPDRTHPYRLKDVVRIVNKRLGNKIAINAYDIQCVRKVHEIEGKPQYFHSPMFSSPQYSKEFIDWLVKSYSEDNLFFIKARYRKKQIDN